MNSIFITCFSLAFELLLIIVFFSKRRLKSIENDAFAKVLIIALFGNVFIIFNYLLLKCNIPENNIIYFLSTKFILIYYVAWSFLFYNYIYLISNKKKISVIYYYVLVALSLLILFLPIDYNIKNNIRLPIGLVVDMVYGLIFLFIVMGIIKMIKNIKNVPLKKYYPLFAFLVVGSIALLIQYYNPDVLLVEFLYALTIYLMYFTIENPDLIIIEELSLLNNVAQQTNISKSEFIMDVTNDIMDKLDSVDNICKNISSDNPSNYTKNEIINLKQIVSTARGKIRNTIDVSRIDANTLKPINSKYNTALLFEVINALCDNKSDSNVKLRLNVEKDIPKELYGDSVKIKQIIMSILDNAFKYTSNGYVELRVHSIIKNNICRLIITIEDTGCGMSIFEINEILNCHEELTIEESANKDEMILNLKTIKKMINLIGGALTIESKENIGSKVTVIIDQKIAQENKSKEAKKIADYEKKFNSIKNIGVITINNNNKEVFEHTLKKMNVNYEIFDETLKCLNNIRNNVKYDLIFIDENMEKIDANSFLSKVKDLKANDNKIIVISKSNDIRHKKELMDSGFASIIVLPIKKDDIKSIVYDI